MAEKIPLIVAFETVHTGLLQVVKQTVAGMDVSHGLNVKVVAVQPEEAIDKLLCTELIPLTDEAIRRAGIVRTKQRAEIGVSLIGSYASAATSNRRKRSCFSMIVAAAVCEHGLIDCGFARNLCPSDVLDQMEKVALEYRQRKWRDFKGTPVIDLVKVGAPIAQALMDCHFTGNDPPILVSLH